MIERERGSESEWEVRVREGGRREGEGGRARGREGGSSMAGIDRRLDSHTRAKGYAASTFSSRDSTLTSNPRRSSRVPTARILLSSTRVSAFREEPEGRKEGEEEGGGEQQ